jgi:hypothetical protein
LCRACDLSATPAPNRLRNRRGRRFTRCTPRCHRLG